MELAQNQNYREMEQTKDTDKSPHRCHHLSFLTKIPKTYIGEKTAPSISDATKMDIYMQNNKGISLFLILFKINFNWIKGLNVIHHSLKLSKGTCQEYQHGLGPSENDSNSSGNKTKNSQIGMHEIEKLPHSKEKKKQ